jgi:hypothetical protein
MSESTHIGIRGHNGLIIEHLPILRTVTLRGIPGFCIHEYMGEYRVSHIEIGGYLARRATDREAFAAARRYSKEEIENRVEGCKLKLARMEESRQRGK